MTFGIDQSDRDLLSTYFQETRGFKSSWGRPDLKKERNYVKKCFSAGRLSDYLFFFYFSPIFRTDDYHDYWFFLTFPLFSVSSIIPDYFFFLLFPHFEETIHFLKLTGTCIVNRVSSFADYIEFLAIPL